MPILSSLSWLCPSQMPMVLPTCTSNVDASIHFDHQESSSLNDEEEDDSTFILVSPQDLAGEVNTQNLLVSPTKSTGKKLCDLDALKPTRSSKQQASSDASVWLASSSILADSGKENVFTSDEALLLCHERARFTLSRTPPRPNVRLPRRRHHFDLGQGTPPTTPWCLPEDSASMARQAWDSDAKNQCTSTPCEGRGIPIPIASPPPLLRLAVCETPAALPRPLPSKMQLPSL